MKAALFTDSYLPNTDGVVSSILAYKLGLEAAGHGWVVFAPDAPGYTEAKGDRVYRYKAFRFPPYPDYRAAIYPYSIPASIARKEKLSLVHSKAMATMAIASYKFARRAKIPCMASVETMLPNGMHYLSSNPHVQVAGKKLIWSYLHWLYSHFDIITAPSEHTKGVLRQNGIESVALPSPIDTTRFAPDAKNGEKVRESLGIGKGEKLVLSIGRVVKEKNYDFILDVAKETRDPKVKFLIVGKGPYLEELQAKASAMGLSGKMMFTGFILGRGQLIHYYNSADAFIFASKFETQGLTLLEAFACGKPAAVMEGTPMAEIVSHGKDGCIFSDDVRDACAKLSSCLQDSKKMAAPARKTALKYSIPSLARRLVGLYKGLL